MRELFEIEYNGRLLGVAVHGHRGFRTYLGFINGQLAALGFGKGALLRNLIQIAKTHPKALPGQRAIVAKPLTAK